MSKKPSGASIIFVILGLVFIALIGIRTISTPEIWTHLAQGRTNAPLSFVDGDSIVNTTHLYDKLAFTFWNIGKAPLLILLNVAGLLTAFILLIQVSKKWGGELSQAFSLLITGHLIFQGLDVGPQTIMMLMIALFVYVLSTQNKPAILFGVLIPMQILWTNMHGSFLFGPLIAGLAVAQAVQNQKGSRKKKKGMPPMQLGILAGVLLAVTLINPYFLKLHGQVLKSVMAPYPTYWASLLRDYFQTPPYGPLVFLSFIIGAGGLITLKKKLPIMLTTLAIIGAFLIIRSVTMAQLFAVLAFPFMVLSFTAIGEYLSGSFKVLLGKKDKLLLPVTRGIFVLLLIISLIPVVSNCAYSRLGSASNFGLGIEENLYPAGAADIIGNEAFPERALNMAADGGYLAFNYPGRKIFIDYRTGRYDREMLENHRAMMLGDTQAYDALYDRYKPEAIIINTLDRVAAQGIATLLSREVWKLAYFDGTTAILLNDKEEFAPILTNTKAQADGLARLEAARKDYAEKVSKGGCAGNAPELIGSGKIFLALNRPLEAKAIFSLLLSGNRKMPDAWIGLGNSQLYLREFDDAVKTLNRATEIVPESMLAWASYAHACRYAGNKTEQERAEKEVLRLAEENKGSEEATTAEVQTLPSVETPSKALQDITIPE